jgi:membrane protein
VATRSKPRGRRFDGARTRGEAVARRGTEWVDRQDPASGRGVAIGAWKRFQDVEGPLQSLLLSTYLLIAVLPALLVMVEYLEANPAALANHLTRHYGLEDGTATLLRGVLVADHAHELGSALLAIAGALFFGLGFGRVLQSVHARAWKLPIHHSQKDQGRYAIVLLLLYGLIALLLFQAKELSGGPSWEGLAVAPGWAALLVVYFAWIARFLTHGRLAWGDLVPGAALTAVGLVVLMIVSSWVMELWVDFYARDYGGFGVVMAIYFWMGFSSFVIVACASVAPALAERRELRDGRRS